MAPGTRVTPDGATSGGTVMKRDVDLRLEDVAFALLALGMLLGLPAFLLLLGLLG